MISSNKPNTIVTFFLVISFLISGTGGFYINDLFVQTSIYKYGVYAIGLAFLIYHVTWSKISETYISKPLKIGLSLWFICAVFVSIMHFLSDTISIYPLDYAKRLGQSIAIIVLCLVMIPIVQNFKNNPLKPKTITLLIYCIIIVYITAFAFAIVMSPKTLTTGLGNSRGAFTVHLVGLTLLLLFLGSLANRGNFFLYILAFIPVFAYGIIAGGRISLLVSTFILALTLCHVDTKRLIKLATIVAFPLLAVVINDWWETIYRTAYINSQIIENPMAIGLTRNTPIDLFIEIASTSVSQNLPYRIYAELDLLIGYRLSTLLAFLSQIDIWTILIGEGIDNARAQSQVAPPHYAKMVVHNIFFSIFGEMGIFVAGPFLYLYFQFFRQLIEIEPNVIKNTFYGLFTLKSRQDNIVQLLGATFLAMTAVWMLHPDGFLTNFSGSLVFFCAFSFMIASKQGQKRNR